MSKVMLQIGMTVEFPRRLSRKNRDLLARCQKVCEELREQGADVDASNLTDVVEALESIASTARRARASAHNRE